MKTKLIHVIVSIILAILLGIYLLTPVRKAEISEAPKYIDVCSFNIKFVGHYTERYRTNSVTGKLVKYIEDAECDVLLVQEVVHASKSFCSLTSEDALQVDPELGAFHNSMRSGGYECTISSTFTGNPKHDHQTVDTGTDPNQELDAGPKQTAWEWYMMYYRRERVIPSSNLPSGFIEETTVHNEVFDRVPFAFSLESASGNLDFVLISVHLDEGKARSSKDERKENLTLLKDWIEANDSIEHDFIIMGDFNFVKGEKSDLPMVVDVENEQITNYISLNHEDCATNIYSEEQPFDHAVYREIKPNGVINTDDEIEDILPLELNIKYGFKVYDLYHYVDSLELVERPCNGENPSVPEEFQYAYSDHNLVKLRLNIPASDDD